MSSRGINFCDRILLTARLQTASEAEPTIHDLCIHPQRVHRRNTRLSQCSRCPPFLPLRQEKNPPPPVFCQGFSLRISHACCPQDTHFWRSFPADSVAEEYNAISSPKSSADPHLRHLYNRKSRCKANSFVCTLYDDLIQCLQELAVLGKANRDLKTQWVAANSRLKL